MTLLHVTFAAALALAAAAAHAQPLATFATPTTQTSCTTCPPGKDGRNGRDGRNGVDGKDGKDGRDGRDGRDAEAPPPVVVAPFDIGFHGVDLSVASFFAHEGTPYVVVYEPTLRAAALVNLETCWAEVYKDFNAGIKGDPLQWRAVQQTGEPFHFAWQHGGAWWGERWPEGLPAFNLQAPPFVIDDPRLGKGTALCRKR